MENMGYHGAIDILQDGIGRIDRTKTPTEITAVYTEGLETCLAFVFVSKKGISLIHSTRSISPASMAEEIHWHEGVLFWTLAYNPEFYPNVVNNVAFQKYLAIFIETIENTAGKAKYLKNAEGSIKLYAAVGGHVTIYRTGRIDVDVIPEDRVLLSNRQLRFDINFVNNFFRRDNETTPADLQFDGFEYTALPPVLLSPEEIHARLQEEKFAKSEHTSRVHLLYKQVVDRQERAISAFFSELDLPALIDGLNAKYAGASGGASPTSNDDPSPFLGLKK